MLAIVSICIVLVFTIISGTLFRKQFKANHISSCLAMFVTMTKSTLVGILTAIWIPDMVLSTIVSITISFGLITFMTYKLSIKIFVESLSMLFMGAMMGVMLSLMTTSYGTLSIMFFTVIYMISVIVAVGLWEMKEHATIWNAIPKKLSLIATAAVIALAASTLVGSFETESNEVEVEHHH
ncbi:hypothetical protein [Lysinibacillus sp. SGAir0095]|uniref:hypothetical protein n=1 Tax=Lysinibacillus sp. SGAir0095 TaxID=2070463 RepID=UPI0010CD43C3|nr:hypothetical protein [Lysinibacillus sp. SGAir0095]QCR31261.1 hypothetical protein C1N55_03400 [Lysinibacillus sp. SGAir0095]